jgi:hypothetical protein
MTASASCLRRADVSETVEDVAALLASLRSEESEEDEGVHAGTIESLSAFPEEVFGRGVALAWEELVAIPKTYAGEVLNAICNCGYDSIRAFNDVYAELLPQAQSLLKALIDFHESEVWLAGPEKGLLTTVRDTFFDSL